MCNLLGLEFLVFSGTRQTSSYYLTKIKNYLPAHTKNFKNYLQEELLENIISVCLNKLK
jgi:hypothetical protein